MGKIYLDTNVYDASLKRIEYIFNEFKHVYFSFSGGKDSGVMVQLANIVANKMGRKFDVLHIDLEGGYKSTNKFVEEISKLEAIGTFYWVCLPLNLRNAVSNLQTHWKCWDEDFKNKGGKWIHKQPKNAINIYNYKELGWGNWYFNGMEFEDFVVKFSRWYAKEKGESTATGIGIRSNESLNRFMSITSTTKSKYKNKNWTTKIGKTYNFYPLYDWETRDIWIATFKHNYFYNEFYETMFKLGFTIDEARICQPFGDNQRAGLNQFKFYEPETWERILLRVSGANFGNIYANTEALGYLRMDKPNNWNWEEYALFLLESIGYKNYDLMLHYANKINKFIKWHEAREDFELDGKWKRVCKMLIKNDFYGRQLSFSKTKKDTETLNKMLNKWGNLL